MTVGQLYRYGKQVLSDAKDVDYSVNSPDVELIFQSITGLSKKEIIIHSDKVIGEKLENAFIEKINLRARAYPLQYILKEWEFMGVQLKVGEGVLIPREDTYCCVELILEKFKKDEKINILELCAGSGAISLALSRFLPNANITAVELYDKAYEYLCDNIKTNSKHKNIKAIKADVRQSLKLKYDSFDVIVSNPPYIPYSELKILQKEVQYEPKEALDGGIDGLDFYRDILSLHLNLLKAKSFIVFEFGDGQKKSIIELLKKHKLKDINIKYDLANNPRAIIARKNEQIFK